MQTAIKTGKAAIPYIVFSVAFVATGCGNKTIVGVVSVQLPGKVTYESSDDGKLTWLTTGSANHPTTLPMGQSFDRASHMTYIVFRDESRNKDHLVTINAIGDVKTVDGPLENMAAGEPSCMRVFKVKASQEPISVEVIPKTIELITLTSKADEPKIVLTSNAAVRVRYPSFLSMDDKFGLDEVKMIRLRKGFLSGAYLEFVLAEREYSLAFADSTVAPRHYAELEHVAKPMAPHIAFATTWTWWPLLIWIPLLVAFIGFIGVIAIIIYGSSAESVGEKLGLCPRPQDFQGMARVSNGDSGRSTPGRSDPAKG